MFMQIVPAPLRQFKTASMILGIVIGSFNALTAMLAVFANIHWLTMNQVIGINAVLGFLIVPAKLWQQQITATTSEKKELFDAVDKQPIKAGQQDVKVELIKTAGVPPTVETPPVVPAQPTKPVITMEMLSKLIDDRMAAGFERRDKAHARRRKAKPHVVPVSRDAP